MLNVRLICVGKIGERFYYEAAGEYEKRLKAYCRLEIIEIPEQRLSKNPSKKEIESAMEKESQLIEPKLFPDSAVIALCIEGKMLSSEEFSSYLEKYALSGKSRVCIIIGGSNGLSEIIKARASLRLSMSKLTFPHHLARVMFLEQLYRALNLSSGGKYHK